MKTAAFAALACWVQHQVSQVSDDTLDIGDMRELEDLVKDLHDEPAALNNKHDVLEMLSAMADGRKIEAIRCAH